MQPMDNATHGSKETDVKYKIIMFAIQVITKNFVSPNVEKLVEQILWNSELTPDKET